MNYRKDADKLEKIKALREASKRVTLGPDALPSVCMYTLLNANSTVTCAEICEDSSLLGVGFTDSIIKIWSLTPQKLKAMKSAEALQDIDREAGNVTCYIYLVYINANGISLPTIKFIFYYL